MLKKRHEQLLQDDLSHLQYELSMPRLLEKLGSAMVPYAVRRSPIVNVPVNFLAKKVFGKSKNVVSTKSDEGKGNRLRNLTLGALEGLGTVLLTRYIGKKF